MIIMYDVPFMLSVILSLLCCLSRSASANCMNSEWQQVFENDKAGKHVSGSLSKLINGINNGARVRVSLGTYFTEADSVSIVKGNVVCGQLLQHVSKASWQSFQSNAYHWWVMACSNGFYQMTRYNVGDHTHRGDTRTKGSFKWFIKKSSILIYANNKNGNRVSGNLGTLIDFVSNGNDIRGTTGSYSFPYDNVQINYQKKLLWGQSLDHVSQRTKYSVNEFQRNAYWWYTSLTSQGVRYMTRYSVGTHVSRGHSNDRTDMKWFVDPCWQHLYTNDANGATIYGTLKILVDSIKKGHRVRFVMDNRYAAEADNIHVKNGVVTIQALKHVSQAAAGDFQDDAYWYWLMLSTTGTVRAYRYKIGEAVHLHDSASKEIIKWYVDSVACKSSWSKLYSHDASGRRLSGNKKDLKSAVQQGYPVRVISDPGTNFYSFSAQNIAVNGDDLAAQTLNHISQSIKLNGEVTIQSNPYWWFTIVTTNGRREMSRWTVGKHQDRGKNVDSVAMEWFVNK
uniref:Shell matrix protein n=1 Tax=Laqueus rubellus TaxID=93892 RepID=A0A3G9CNH9_LAQRU